MFTSNLFRIKNIAQSPSIDFIYWKSKNIERIVEIFGAIFPNWIISCRESEFGELSEISVDATEKQKKEKSFCKKRFLHFLPLIINGYIF